jgi:ketosteroid isomerase-like protein
MKSVKHIALVLVTFSLLVVPLAWSQGGSAEQQIKKATDQIITALLKGDPDSYEKLLSDDYIGIRGDGILLTKAQEVESVKSGALKYETNDVRDLKIRVYGDTAVATARVFSKGITNGKPHSGSVRITRVWQKQKGIWKCVSYQVTRVSQ